MADKSKIEWTDATWNPIRGCTRVSEGCRNCYAEKVAARFSGPGQAYEGLAVMKNHEARWTGKVAFVEKHLFDPLKWKTPRRIFVNSMSDLFHEGIPEQRIIDIFGVMTLAYWHTFQILTKRPERMLAFLNGGDHGIRNQFRNLQAYGGTAPGGVFRALYMRNRDGIGWNWPLPNVWLGVSVEDQKTADERIPLLLATPAAVRWISYEPALGPIEIEHWLAKTCRAHDPQIKICDGPSCPGRGIDWLVCGGESGPGARPMHSDWARSIRNQCADMCVPFFFKQWGDWIPGSQLPEKTELTRRCPAIYDGETGLDVYRVGKKEAGRVLDGREWNEYPEAISRENHDAVVAPV